jgi:NitT/TauT family transport system ATP-binding protein
VTNPPTAVSLRQVTRQFGSRTVLQQVTFDVEPRRFISIVGPSGCGKSTLLHLVAGLLPPTDGRIEIFGEPLTGLNRHAAYLFQQDALLPWKTVLDNIRLGLTLRGHEPRESRERAAAWTDRVGLRGFAHHFPHQLSGGMRKRVALAQCLIIQPDLLLMDEPFSALDVHTRLRMETELLDLWTGSETTVLFVTHDLEEAIGLSDEVLVLSAGPASRIIGRYPVALTRPRSLIDMKADPHFQDLYRLIWTDLRREVLESYERAR